MAGMTNSNKGTISRTNMQTAIISVTYHPHMHLTKYNQIKRKRVFGSRLRALLRRGFDSVRIKSFTGDAWYSVSLERRTCVCTYFKATKLPCKHLQALGVHSKAR